ncbi:galectin-5-like [Ruditapes philippinarum]|uniref:galectin-5-like n=1 Tax=Ruditapes philippinarum TaxID=129788 RepID=UPI00295A86D1|nr:galectin-5-like [Ruditapes philippinarum]
MTAVHVPYPGESCCQGLCGQKFYDPSLPFRHRLGCLYPGKMIFISGIPSPSSSRFSINLKSVGGQSKSNAFHFDVRFDYGNCHNEIVRNANINGSWGQEEKSLSCPFPFRQNAFFEMIILVDKSSFKVAVNGEHILEFRHRFPIENIDKLVIKRDVRITMIRIQG